MEWKALPPLGALRAFTALADTGSITAAGTALGVSHAAVSQQVRSLEERLGTRLTQKAGRGVALTPEGRRLATALDGAFTTMALAVAEFSELDAGRALQVTTTPAFAGRWLMPRLSEFRHEQPGIDIILHPAPGLVELAPGGVDIAIRFGLGAWPGLEAWPLVPTSLVIVAAESLVRDRPIRDPRDLLEFPWLQELGTSEMSEWLVRRGVLVPRRESVVHLPGYLVIDALLAGGGVTVSARSNVAREIEDGRLRVLFEDILPGQGYYVVTRPGVMRSPLKAFVSWLRRHAEPGPGGGSSATPCRD